MKIDITFTNGTFEKINKDIIEFLKGEIETQESTDKTVDNVCRIYTDNDCMLELNYDEDGNIYVLKIEE